jgi:prolyl-tRNA editing enzyme YbaK/EbsC (Cys-tRNA(Pro) deacylase)
MTAAHPAVEPHLHAITHSVMACDPQYADTAAFCDHYGIDPADSANTILIASKRPPGHFAACVVLATTRLDVNRAVRDRMGVKKLSFASADLTLELSGMEIGGVTPFGLPEDMMILVDSAVMGRAEIVLGGGNRTSKLRLPPTELLKIPNLEVVEGLASPIQDVNS